MPASMRAICWPGWWWLGLSGLVVFGSRLAAYNSDVVGDPVLYPRGTFPVPDLRVTYVKKSS